jgi:4-amino-4-deoxy-L-arabinose transferase-like glycosyltransferase
LKRQRLFLTLILATYLLLALWSGAVNPLFEAPDEIWHYFTAQTIAETGELPAVQDEPDLWMSQEAAQPPLYYVLGAMLIAPIDTSQARDLVWENPAVQLGDASSPTNTNAFVHTSAEAWPWHGYSLAVHVIRAFSAILGLGTLLAIYGSGRLLWPAAPERALLATALIGFLPQFIFLHGSITNDALIIFISSVALWQLLAMWYGQPSWGRLVLLGITVGLAILTKLAGLLLLAYAAGFLTLLIWRDYRHDGRGVLFRQWLRAIGSVVIISFIIGGWMLGRNWLLYGDPTATNKILQFFGGSRDYTLWQVFNESSGLWTSLFAVFGWFNVRPPGWVYLIWNGIVLAALLGLVVAVGRRLVGPNERRATLDRIITALRHPATWVDRPGFPAALLGVWVLVVYAGLIRWMLQIHAGQGRLLFPALLPAALALSYGLSRYRWPGVYLIAPLLALATSLYSVAVVIPEAYALPAMITESQIPAGATRFDADLGQGLRLVAAEIHTEQVQPDEWAYLTLYWQAEEVPEGAAEREAPQFVLELFGQELDLVGKLQSYHGGGRYPASLWTAGQIVVDPIGVKIDEQARTPVKARLFVRLADPGGSSELGAIKISPEQWPPSSSEVLARVDGIELVAGALSQPAARPGETATIHLRWQVVDPPSRDLTTFVHLGDPSQTPLAQGDSPPLGGYYPTSIWAAGEVIDDTYSLTLPADLSPGRYPIYVGLYDPANGTRMALEIDGQRQANDAYLIGWLTVED